MLWRFFDDGLGAEAYFRLAAMSQAVPNINTIDRMMKLLPLMVGISEWNKRKGGPPGRPFAVCLLVDEAEGD